MDWSKRLAEVLEITIQLRRCGDWPVVAEDMSTRELPSRSKGRLMFGGDFESELVERGRRCGNLEKRCRANSESRKDVKTGSRRQQSPQYKCPPGSF